MDEIMQRESARGNCSVCTAELMRIGPSYHEQPGANMLVLRDKSASSTWSAGYINTLFTLFIHNNSYCKCAHLRCFCTSYQVICVEFYVHVCV